MVLRTFLAVYLLFFSTSLFSQKKSSVQVAVPDSVKKICDELFLYELGKKMFKSCLTFNSSAGLKSTYANGEIRLDYTLQYTFSFPDKAEATFPLQMNYAVYSGKGRIQSTRFLRLDQSDLPKNVKKKGTAILSFEKAKSVAVKADSLMTNSVGRFVLGQDNFYWHFSYSLPDTNSLGEAESHIIHTIIIDVYSGKILSVYSGSE